MGTVTLTNIEKNYGQTRACADISLNIHQGEFFTLLGPSGCGKTTLLRIVAGLITPDRGNILIGKQDVTETPTEKRAVGMVFQNYALFPFMTVYENVEYSLKISRLSKVACRKRVEKYLEMVQLSGYEKRQISELSGGEQQRVALARSLAMEPKVLLLDEPLSNLDARLRASMRIEISKIIRNLGITTLFVTHDQTEALSMSDRIAVFNKGKCLQVGTPEAIYNQPQNAFVAEFVGDTNLWSRAFLSQNPEFARAMQLDPLSLQPDERISLRPQNLHIKPLDTSDSMTARGIVEDVFFTGSLKEYQIGVAGQTIKVSQPNTFTHSRLLAVGDPVQIEIDPHSVVILKA